MKTIGTAETSKLEKHIKITYSIEQLEKLELEVISFYSKITNTPLSDTSKATMSSELSLQDFLDTSSERIDKSTQNIRKTLDDIYKVLFG